MPDAAKPPDCLTRAKDLQDLLGKVVRLQITFRKSRLYALRGNFHFCDALDVALLEDGKPIDPNFLDVKKKDKDSPGNFAVRDASG